MSKGGITNERVDCQSKAAKGRGWLPHVFHPDPGRDRDKAERDSSKTGRSRNELIGLFLEYAADNCIVKEKEER
jgi:hypothetical protein